MGWLKSSREPSFDTIFWNWFSQHCWSYSFSNNSYTPQFCQIFLPRSMMAAAAAKSKISIYWENVKFFRLLIICILPKRQSVKHPTFKMQLWCKKTESFTVLYWTSFIFCYHVVETLESSCGGGRIWSPKLPWWLALAKCFEPFMYASTSFAKTAFFFTA